jgi:hypothetical protein
MQKPREADEHDYEHIVGMSQEFNLLDPETLTGTTGEYWHLRIMLSISQQLSVIAAALKRKPE